MESDGNIAQISFEPRTRNVKGITFFIRNLRFKCKRCATFCCKLGGPTLSLNDVDLLKKAGYKEVEFFDDAHSSLKNKADGSCVFLQLGKERHFCECSVYDSRPALCRLYPFHFEKISPCSFMLKLLPCRGINRRYGELVAERFIVTHLLGALCDSCF
jgi:Fe-S-cluster containining protein